MNFNTFTKSTGLFAVFLFSALFTISKAQELEISGELRVRPELNHGLGNIPVEQDEAIFYTGQRTRLNISFAEDKLSSYLSLHDVRLWGSENVISGTGIWADDSGLDIHQAWAQYQFTPEFALKAGRQEFKYDDQRFLSWRNWNNYGLTYDALLFKYEESAWKAHLGLSYHSKANPTFGDNSYYADGKRFRSFHFLYLNRAFNDQFEASAKVFMSGKENVNNQNETHQRFTYGLFAKYTPGPLNVEGNLFFQSGEDARSRDVSAYMGTLTATYKLDKLALTAGAVYLSGDDPGNDDYGEKDRTFDLLYGTRHAYYGWLNHFNVVESSTNSAGLINVFPSISYSISPKSTFKVFQHFFLLANDANAVNPQTNVPFVIEDRFLGSETDASVSYAFSDTFKLTVGMSYFWHTESMEQLRDIPAGDADSTYWGWVMMQFNPVFFSQSM